MDLCFWYLGNIRKFGKYLYRILCFLSSSATRFYIYSPISVVFKMLQVHFVSKLGSEFEATVFRYYFTVLVPFPFLNTSSYFQEFCKNLMLSSFSNIYAQGHSSNNRDLGQFEHALWKTSVF